MAEEEDFERDIKKIANGLRINWPVASIAELESIKSRIKQADGKRWASLGGQGKGVKDFLSDPLGNEWVTKGGIPPGMHIEALKMRSDTLGNRTTLAGAGYPGDVNCRRCRAWSETIGHIVENCPRNKGLVIRRHEDFMERLTGEIGKE